MFDFARFPVPRRAILLSLELGLLLAPPLAAAPPVAPVDVDRSRWQSAFYVVRPGDTLESLAQRLLGSSELWRELAQLNPGVEDPDRIYPGQRLRVYQDPPTIQPTARIEALSRRVEERPQPVPWRPANEGDLLVERDSVRTYADASARLRFDDGAEVTLTEESLVFLRRQTPVRAPQPRREIEVLVGQADLTSRGVAGKRIDVEVVVGDARSVGSAGDDQPLRTRSRRAVGDAAQFMNYEGATEVAAAGQKVALPAGSGTQVAPRSAPGAVELLLPAPVPSGPAAGEEVERAAAILSWTPVAGAASYLVEVCADAGCGALVERASGLAATTYTITETQRESVYWRVTAVSASGLDGFPSAARTVRLVDSIAPGAPVVALRGADGGEVAPGDCVAVPPVAVVRALDRRGAQAAWTLLVDGGESDPPGLAALAGGVGGHQVAARAVDARGRSASSAPIEFRLDGAAPWLALAASGEGPDRDERRKQARRPYPRDAERPSACGDVGLEAIRLPDGAPAPIPCGTQGEPLRLALDGDLARIEVALSGSALRVGEQIDADRGERLRLTAGDVGCGLAALELRVVPSRFAAGTLALEASATDRAGNRSTSDWHLEPRAGGR